MKKSVVSIGIFFAVLGLPFLSCSVEPGTSTTLPGGGTTTSTSTSTTSTTLSYCHVVYVSSSGSDLNDGMYPAAPLLSLDKALAIAVASNASYLLVAGDYTLSSNADSARSGWLIENVNGLTISGGWGDDFTTQNVKSVLEAATNTHFVTMCKSIVAITGCRNFVFTNFEVLNAMSLDLPGGGVYADNLSNCTLSVDATWCIGSYGGGLYLGDSSFVKLLGYYYCNQGYTGEGGGIYVTNCKSVSVDLSSVYNDSANSGGGLAVFGSSNVSVTGLYCSNVSRNNFGGGLYFESTRQLNVEAFVVNNKAFDYCGGIVLEIVSNFQVSALVTNNEAASYSAIYIDSSGEGTLSGQVSGNRSTQNNAYGGGMVVTYSGGLGVSADFIRNSSPLGGGAFVANSSNVLFTGNFYSNAAKVGGGVYLMNALYCNFDSDFYGNFATNSGGAVCCTSSVSNAFNGNVDRNVSRIGGGMYISGCRGLSVTGNVAGNTAYTNGGGLYLLNTRNCVFSGAILSNSTWLNGGGMYLSGSSNNVVTAGAEVRFNHADSDGTGGGSGGGIYLNPLSYPNTISPSALTNPNFVGSGTSVTNDVDGI